jgi:hypothetical protein
MKTGWKGEGRREEGEPRDQHNHHVISTGEKEKLDVH